MATVLNYPEEDQGQVGADSAFTYDKAFSRTLGFVTPQEMRTLRKSKIAVAGLGGVGGIHLETLTRLGIGKFHIADFDHFEIHNFNRQAGARVSTLGLSKAEVMAKSIRDINPELDVTLFDKGINVDNIDAFLEGVDLYIDSLDFFAFDARALVFAACAAKGIPAVTAAPIGMGVGLMSFLPGKMTFEEYFQWAGQDDRERALRMLIGISPKAGRPRYLVWPRAIDFFRRKVPSTPMGCSLCAGFAATEALKILLRRGPVKCAPHSVVYDAYLGRVFRSWMPGGMRNPLMRFQLMIVRAFFKRMVKAKPEQ